MFESRKAAAETQQEFWIETRRLPQATASTFYRKLDQTLDAIGFTAGVREICLPAYAEAARGGRPGIDPAVYFKMLMIGFFENLPSERAIASHCADSLSLRVFLGYAIEEATPDHSSLSVIEANASLRERVHRNTEEQYWEYVKRLGAEAGIDPDDTKAVRRFDKKREGRRTSNKEWVNPHDPDAKVGMTKHGTCDMIYKPEHVTDLESGAIVAATVRLGDEGDTRDRAARVLEAGGEKQERQGAAPPARRAPRTRLLPRARSWRPEAGDVARSWKPHQAPARWSAGVQPVAADAPPHRSRHAQAVAGGGFWRRDGPPEGHCGEDRALSAGIPSIREAILNPDLRSPNRNHDPDAELIGRFFNRLVASSRTLCMLRKHYFVSMPAHRQGARKVSKTFKRERPAPVQESRS